MILIRTMHERDIDVILRNFAEQGWSKPREVLENMLTTKNIVCYASFAITSYA